MWRKTGKVKMMNCFDNSQKTNIKVSSKVVDENSTAVGLDDIPHRCNDSSRCSVTLCYTAVTNPNLTHCFCSSKFSTFYLCQAF